jgi:pyrroline-5-carboxylate reductase
VSSPVHGRKIAFLGAGNMAEALIKGLLRSGIARPEDIVATVRRPDRGEELRRAYPIAISTDNATAAQNADIVVLAVKPQAMGKLLVAVAPAIDHRQLVISVAAGVPIAALERKLGAGARIVRAMPNTPALVGAGATALARGEHATEQDLEIATALFDAVGITVAVDEGLLDAVTGLSGSGPAYVFLVIEALCDAGVKVGLPRYSALKLASQTLFGSAKLLIETGAHPGQLKDQVTSPGGTAIAGLHTLEAGGLRTTLINAVEAATERARQLGEQFLEKS